MSVLLCPGQGAQKPGMGADLLGEAHVAEACSIASEVFACDFAQMLQSGDDSWAGDTTATQAITALLSIGIGRAVLDARDDIDAIVGFSLGQISALALADVLPTKETFELLAVRAQAMGHACAEQDGAMLALLGTDEASAQKTCDACAQGEVLVAANYNCPGQIVLSGTTGAIDRAAAYWKEQGKRATKLNVAGGFHSPLMQSAADELAAYCEGVDFHTPAITLICNTDAQEFRADEAANRLARHLTNPVRFSQSIEGLLRADKTTFIEAGYGNVLGNLVKRINRNTTRLRTDSPEALEQVLA